MKCRQNSGDFEMNDFVKIIFESTSNKTFKMSFTEILAHIQTYLKYTLTKCCKKLTIPKCILLTSQPETHQIIIFR